jgi:hypothetical protein
VTGPGESNVVHLVAAAAAAGNALPAGWRLHEFEIEFTLGEGGFGIVYLASDRQLRRLVAIKEFMPSTLAARGPAMSVSVKSDRYRATFDAALRSFINEARLLAQFDHPALVKVYRFWEENGTAYMVMPYYKGQTFKQWLKAQSARPSEEVLLRLIGWLLEPVEQLHSQNVFHRDIAPDNVLLLENGRPLLLDFGAARRIIGDMTQALTAFLKPGYTPIEQYAEVQSMRQGPWTDVYALAALLYVAVTGRAPPPAVERMMKDDYVPAAGAAAGCYSDRLLAAIDRGLMLRPQDRPATIGQLRELLGLAGASRPPAPAADEATTATLLAPPSTPPATAPAAQPATPDRPPAHSAPAARSRIRPIAAGVTAALLIVGAGVTWWRARPGAEPSMSNSAVSVPPPPPSAMTPIPGDSRLVPPPPSQPPAVEAARARPPDPADVVREVYEAREPSIAVQARATKSRLVIGRDQMRLSVVSSRGGYLNVLMAGTQGELAVLVPNNGQGETRLEPGRELGLPAFDASGPPGVDRLVFIVSERRLALDARLAQGESFPRFDLRRIAAPGSSTGQPRCSGVIACGAVYGAAMLEVREVDRDERGLGR